MIFANIDPRSAQPWPKSKCYFHMPMRTLLLWLHIWFTKSDESLSKIGAKFWSLQPLFNQTSHWLLLPASSFSDLHADGRKEEPVPFHAFWSAFQRKKINNRDSTCHSKVVQMSLKTTDGVTYLHHFQEVFPLYEPLVHLKNITKLKG